MYDRALDDLFLERQPGPDLHFASDPERIDALVTHRLGSAQVHLFPVVGFTALVFETHGLSRFGKSEQVEPPVCGQVRDGKEV